ncbi:MAG: methyltransferase domain-containing protein [Deltaproteobacteria bacterium]|jgi:ubiquinone/menaquinone biosynthesis C-methylase UbiE|nr:methyltransferase domain-containing protein [Deltaproteobacteria bacterium]
MIRNPYRHLYFSSPAANMDDSLLSSIEPELDGYLFDRLDLSSGDRMLLVGAGTPDLIPLIRIRLGITGRLLVTDPDPEALWGITGYDADWAILLEAKASALPLRNSYLPTIVCWDSFLAIDDKKTAVKEFFRVLRPGGRVLIAQNGPGKPHGKPRPCSCGLRNLFIEAGFSKIDLENNEEMFLFSAEKVPGFFVASPASA